VTRCILKSLTQFRVNDPVVLDALRSGKPGAVLESARQAAAATLSDCALIQTVGGDMPGGLELLDLALKISPTSQTAFHNLVSLLLTRNLLRGDNLKAVHGHMMRHLSPRKRSTGGRGLSASARDAYFLNLEFVKGKCNLNCRMCIGTNAEGRKERFECMSANDFEATLAAAPTVSGLTLSSETASLSCTRTSRESSTSPRRETSS